MEKISSLFYGRTSSPNPKSYNFLATNYNLSILAKRIYNAQNAPASLESLKKTIQSTSA